MASDPSAPQGAPPPPADNDLAGWTTLAKRLGKAQRIAEAIAAWRRVLAIDPAHARAHAHLAHYLFQGATPPEAIPHLLAVTERSPDDVDAWRRLARARDHAIDMLGARAAWREVARLAPDDAEARKALARPLDAGPARTARADGGRAPLIVVTPAGVKNMFRVLEEPRLGVHLAHAPDTPEPDLLVLPCGTNNAIAQSRMLAAGLPDGLRARIADGRTTLILDASTEGEMHRPDRTERLHGLLACLDVAPQRAIYVTQDRHYDSDYAAHAGPARMQVMHYDVWIWRFFENFRDDGEAVFEERLAQFKARAPRRERRLVSLNFTPRPAKVLFLLSLMRDGLWDEGFISFGGFERYSASIGLTVDTLAAHFSDPWFLDPEFESLTAELTPLLPRLAAVGEQLLEGGRSRKAPISDGTVSEYGRSWFTVVTETEMSARPHRITEKPFKSLVNFHPILILGNPEALAMVRGFGFETFPEIFDEDYDEEMSPRRRFDRVYGEVVRLCRQDEAEWVRMEAKIAEKLEHNARWGLTRFPHDYRMRESAALVDRLEALMKVARA